MKVLINNAADNIYVIDIDGAIGQREDNEFSYEQFKRELEQIDQVQDPKVTINIRSTGGDVNEALLIYDALAELKNAHITTCCYGYVASAATIIAQAASLDSREISANALYLVHRSMSLAEGNRNNLSQMVDLLDKTDQRIASIYSQRSGKPIDDFIELMNQNNGDGIWLTPSEAIDAGLVDKLKDNEIGVDQSSKIIENQKQEKMNISKHWMAILDVLGLSDNNNEAILNENSLERIDNKLVEDSKKIADMTTKISSLEVENARLNALATATLQKEDPSAKDVMKTANQMAYSADIEKFK